MWGKNSHVISPELSSNHKFWTPVKVDTGGHQLAQLACGAWHMAATTGKPGTPLLNLVNFNSCANGG